ncbi:MAG: glycosyltransferase involved in cell wall biosynthesis [Cyclobacteriaceae bacterium]|jgi:glycosyltransferase involved in cell wall biosynthesis
MRIGIEAQRIFRPKKHGMDIYALQLIRHLQEIDHVNEYFIFVRPGTDICLKPTHNFEIVQINSLTYADWEQIWLPQNVTDYNIDILHCTSNTAPLFCAVPTVVTIHDIIYLNSAFSGGSLYQKLGHYYRKWIVPKVYNRATKVMTVSNFEVNTIEKYFGDNDKLEVAYNGINPMFNQRANDELISRVRQDLGLPEDYILFLGNTAPKKNMSRVLDAYAKYRIKAENPLPLVIVETGSDIALKMLEDLGYSETMDDIHCVGYVPNDNLPVVYQEATLFLYPSLRESFGIPIIESMASGTPVITSSTSSMPEVGQDAAHYVDPYSTVMLAAKIDELLSDKELLENLAEKGYARAKQFSWANTAEQVHSSYFDICYGKVEHQKAS